MIIGITGGIASGKSAVSHYLEEQGHPVIDTDILSREVIAEEAIIEAIVQAFGEQVLDNGRLSREKLGKCIFSDEEARKTLNAIMHPAILDRTKEVLGTYAKEELVFLVVPLLYETGFDVLCDEVWLVLTDSILKEKRLMARDDIDAAYAEQKIASQMDDATRLSYHPTVIHNNGTLAELHVQVDKLLKTIEKN